MNHFTRRHFLKLAGQMSAAMGLSLAATPQVASALEHLVSDKAKVLWIQAQSCSGCSISMLNSEEPGPEQLLTQYISLLFHQTLSAATGQTGLNVLEQSIEAGDYILVVEGSIPAGMPEACTIGHEPVADIISRAAQNAKAVVSIGTCAAFGGIPAAEGNPTGAISVQKHLEKERVQTPVINIPGCPSHPDWLVGTLVHISQFGIPKCDSKGRPEMFFSRTNHDQCPRYSDYERGFFAQSFSDDGCLFKLGCLGVITAADCTTRLRNGGTNSCINSGAPCLGCASPIFAQKKSIPFYRENEIQGGRRI